MSDEYQNHFYIEGPYVDLVNVTKLLDFSGVSTFYDGWEIEGGSAVLHFHSYHFPVVELSEAAAHYPSLKIVFRYTYALVNAGLIIYEDGRRKLTSYYDWDTGISEVTGSV